MKRLTVTIIACMMAVVAVFAQSKKNNTLTGRVLDSETGEALMRCSVALMSEDTTKLITGTVTAQDGSFTLKNVKNGSYVTRITYIGYHNFYHKKVVTDEAASHKLGTVLLVPASIELQSAVVTAQMKEVEVKDDTLMFNAAAFKVPEGSVLEELIRKLPGVTIEDDGTIKVNGKTVKKILVEGKEFFSDNKNMAMKNLPTEIIDKVKTYDKQSDLSRITGIDDGEEETVIDLSIKKGMRQGWFGNVDLGYGSEERYTEKLSLNRFQDNLQASVIGSINNINDQTGGGGGRARNNGITTSGQVGLRLVMDKKNVEWGGNIQYSGQKTNSTSSTASQNFVSRNASYSNRWSESINRNKQLRGDFKLELKIDSLTTLLFRPQFSYRTNDSESNNESLTFNADPYLDGIVTNPLRQRNLINDSIKVNENASESWSDGSSYNVGGNIMLNRQLGGKPWFGPAPVKGKKGRNIGIRFNGSVSGTENKTYNFSNVIYHQRNDSTDLTYRHRSTPQDSRNYSIGFNYSEPILRNLFAQVNYSYNYDKRHSDGKTYDFGHVDSIGEKLWEQYGQFGLLAPNYFEFVSDSLSRYSDNFNYTHNLELSFRYITSILNLSVGVRYECQRQKMVYQYQGLDTIASRTFSRISPTLNARFRFDKQHTLRLTYRGNTQQPSMTDMFNLEDKSNPLNIREGNPDLKPSFTNNVTADYNRYFASTNQSLFGRFTFSNTFNSISNRTEYNEETGGQRTRPENINGDWKTGGNIGFNTPLIWQKLMLNTNTSASYSNSAAYIYQNKETMKNNVKQTSLGENISFTVRLNSFDVRTFGNVRWTKAVSEVIDASNRNTFDFHYGLSSTGNFDNGFGYSTDIGVSSRRGYASASMNTDEIIWNAQVSYRFFKNRVATVSLAAYDILHQRSNISRMLTATSRSDSETNAINSYVMCHFIYRLNLFGSREARRNMRNANFNMFDGEGREGGREGNREGVRERGGFRASGFGGMRGGGR
ncbi:MAG: TonB-dependent receptor [Bacteroidaceae bacterium]|nr:TonB-dependent receptor [Bacteroidaceae bacterium]